MRIFRAAALVAALLAAPAAQAQHQHMIPAPYSSGADTHMLVAPQARHHQYLVPTPYPNNLGPYALGNPRAQGVYRHQRRVSTHRGVRTRSYRAPLR